MMQIFFWIVVAIIGIGLILLGNRLIKDAPKNDGCIDCKSYQPDDDMWCLWENDCKEKTK